MKDSCNGLYLQLASFLRYDPVEWKDEDDGGDPSQSRRPEMLKERKTVVKDFSAGTRLCCENTTFRHTCQRKKRQRAISMGASQTALK